MPQRRYNNLLVALTVLLFALPVLLDVSWNGADRVLAYFASDTFYYLTVARNFAATGTFTFDQQFPTTGFHPLWQVLLGYAYRLGIRLGTSPEEMLLLVFLLSVLAISLAILVLGRTLSAEGRALPAVFVLLPVGTYALLVLPLDRRVSSLWGSVNGMESGLVILGYALLLSVMATRPFLETYSSAFATGLLLGFILLARLDHAFLSIALVAVVGAQMAIDHAWERLRFLAVVCIVVGTVLLAYLASNYWYAGTMMPVSGTLKSSFPHPISDNIHALISAVVEPLQPITPVHWRLTQMFLPMFSAVGFLLWRVARVSRRAAHTLDTPLVVTSVFVLLLGSYNALYVRLWDQGSWYFPVSTLYMSLLAIYIAGGSDPRGRPHMDPGRSVVRVVAAAVVCMLFFWASSSSSSSRSHYTRHAHWFREQAPQVKQFYAKERVRFLEFDDGIVTFATGLPAMSGLGFALDAAGAEAKNAQSLLALAFERGYDRIVSVEYFDAIGLHHDTPSEIVKERLGKTFFLSSAEVGPFSFWIEYLSPDGHVAVIRMWMARPDY